MNICDLSIALLLVRIKLLNCSLNVCDDVHVRVLHSVFDPNKYAYRLHTYGLLIASMRPAVTQNLKVPSASHLSKENNLINFI